MPFALTALAMPAFGTGRMRHRRGCRPGRRRRCGVLLLRLGDARLRLGCLLRCALLLFGSPLLALLRGPLLGLLGLLGSTL